jgi:hypothetical protein
MTYSSSPRPCGIPIRASARNLSSAHIDHELSQEANGDSQVTITDSFDLFSGYEKSDELWSTYSDPQLPLFGVD